VIFCTLYESSLSRGISINITSVCNSTAFPCGGSPPFVINSSTVVLLHVDSHQQSGHSA
jgi:hypothetical protein